MSTARISAILPRGVRFASTNDFDCDPDTTGETSTEIICVDPALSRAGDTATINFVVAPVTAGLKSVTVRVSSSADPVATNDSKSTTVSVAGHDCTWIGTNAADKMYRKDFYGPAVICGLGGNDEIYGPWGAGRINHIYGGAGNDRIYGDYGDDTILGGLGADTIAGGPGSDDIRGGPGTDTLMYEYAKGGVNVSLAYGRAGGKTAAALAGTDTLRDLENVRGSQYADTVSGNANRNVISGLGGKIGRAHV